MQRHYTLMEMIIRLNDGTPNSEIAFMLEDLAQDTFTWQLK